MPVQMKMSVEMETGRTLGIAQKWHELQMRTEALQMEMEQACLTEKAYNPPEVLTLNVGGAKLLLKRSAMAYVEDSKLAWMFNGRWDHVLPRDHSGRIFLDLDINWFRPITNFLSELSQGAEAGVAYLPIMQLMDDDRVGVQACMELFGLCDIVSAQGIASVPLTQHVTSVAHLGQESGLEIGWSAPWQLLYQSSVNGAIAHDFHRLCDGKPNTVSLAVDEKGNVFGGLATVAWASHSSRSWQPDRAAFLFYEGSGSTAMQRYSQARNNIQSAVFHHSSYGPVFGNGYDLVFTFIGGTITHTSSTQSFQPLPIKGTSGTVIDLFVWQVPQTGGSAPLKLSPSPRADATASRQPVCNLSYNSDSAPPLKLRADMSSLTGPATTLSFHFGLWLKEQLDAFDNELQAVERRAELFAAEKAFLQQLAPEDIDGRKRAWLEKVGTYIRVHNANMKSLGGDIHPPAPPSPLKGVHNGIVYITCWGGGQLCTMRETFKQFGRSMLANKYASDVWARNVRAAALDDDGCVVEDHNHECFQKLVNVMRLRAIVTVRRPGFSGTIGSAKPSHMPAHLALAMSVTEMLNYLAIDHEQFVSALDSPV
ncbi:hypothetical protein JKP88DRAFT_249569 [Tribonema minus]|uniref:TLDc domain-containing protein n=1 Tax=Tribonema minus TaxID=303371 RepID=A0A835YTK3_9STRA|nr:hypothetical protein JKP88DRAFT_249569 [Tribonema minus]